MDTFEPDLRHATADEIAQLKEYIRQNPLEYGLDEEGIDLLVGTAYIAVFPEYLTGGPGYGGKVLVAVYDGGPQQTETFSWNDGEIRRNDPERLPR